MLLHIWQLLKRQRRLRLGPATLHMQFVRSPPVRKSPRTRPLRNDRHRPEAGTVPRTDSLEVAAPAEAYRQEAALLIGVGPGLGNALAKTLAGSGFRLGLVARDGVRLESLAASLRNEGATCKPYPCDVTHESSVESLFDSFTADFGAPDLVVYGLQSFGPGNACDVGVPAFEDGWRHNCFGAFLVSRAATRIMAANGRGTLVLVGSTSALLGREGHLNLAVGKFGQRALAQVLAREVWPKGVHVVHMVIDADIREGEAESYPQAEPTDLAKAVLFLHRQPRSAWTSEIDLRPWNEKFWEHC